jgi:hypothetical protein
VLPASNTTVVLPRAFDTGKDCLFDTLLLSSERETPTSGCRSPSLKVTPKSSGMGFPESSHLLLQTQLGYEAASPQTYMVGMGIAGQQG